METRQLLRSDLPKRRFSPDSLHIPVLQNGVVKYISDIHFANNDLCWLEGGKGKPTKIKELKLITKKL